MDSKQRRFEMLVGAFTDDLYRFGYWLCRDPSVADDLVQETLMRAWRFMDNLRDSNAVKSWLLTTMRREHARLYERKRFDTVDIADYEIADTNGTGPDQQAHIDQVRNELMQLSIEYREPLVLQVLMGHSVSEIADILELSESAVMTRLFRARKQLSQRLHGTDISVGMRVVR